MTSYAVTWSWSACMGCIPRSSTRARRGSSGCWSGSAIPSASCRRWCMSPAPTARARRSRSARDAAGGRPPRAALHLAASGALPRAHPVRGRADRRADAGRRARAVRAAPTAARRSPFFEITTAAAFLAFARRPADVLLLETGLGGRLDATNVIARRGHRRSRRSRSITMQFLGETLAADRVREGRHPQARRALRGRPAGRRRRCA